MCACENNISLCINSNHIYVCNINYIFSFENGVNMWNNNNKKLTSTCKRHNWLSIKGKTFSK